MTMVGTSCYDREFSYIFRTEKAISIGFNKPFSRYIDENANFSRKINNASYFC